MSAEKIIERLRKSNEFIEVFVNYRLFDQEATDKLKRCIERNNLAIEEHAKQSKASNALNLADELSKEVDFSSFSEQSDREGVKAKPQEKVEEWDVPVILNDIYDEPFTVEFKEIERKVNEYGLTLQDTKLREAAARVTALWRINTSVIKDWEKEMDYFIEKLEKALK